MWGESHSWGGEFKHRYRHRELINDPRQGGWGPGVLYVD